MTTPRPELRVRFTKRTDGAVILQCIRKDGSATWQRHDKQATFFSLHDLAHFAVETALGFRKGFFGLIADGWDISDTTGKGARGKLPAESILVEHLVGLFDREEICGPVRLTAAEFNAQLNQLAAADSLESGFVFTEAQLNEVRVRIDMLQREWVALKPGETFELSFDRYGIGKTTNDAD